MFYRGYDRADKFVLGNTTFEFGGSFIFDITAEYCTANRYILLKLCMVFLITLGLLF